MKILLSIFAVLLISGCAGFGQVERVSDLTTEQLQKVHQVKTFRSPPENFVSLGRIKGLACKGSGLSGTPTEESAMTQLKIKAVLVDADGILYPTCSQDNSVDWGNNCWESWVCVGEAVKLN